MSSINSKSKGTACSRHLNLFRMLAVTLGVLLLCVPAFSQGNAGRIMGTVTDQSGGGETADEYGEHDARK